VVRAEQDQRELVHHLVLVAAVLVLLLLVQTHQE
jgi:hypothetical protein